MCYNHLKTARMSGHAEWRNSMELIYRDSAIVVCVKPSGVLSTDEPGGVPELAREALGEPEGCVRTVHRLDRVVGGLMVLARSPEAASELSRQIRENLFEKDYLAVVHWRPDEPSGVFRDLLQRDPAERKTRVVKTPGKGVQAAVLAYETLGSREGISLVKIRLLTGRTHQIRAQFSSRGLPLVGDRKYSLYPDECPIALWSHRLRFSHPLTGEVMEFIREPPELFPWTVFAGEPPHNP